MNYYDNVLSYYKVIINRMKDSKLNINEDIAREAFNYYMNNLTIEERERIINEMRYATGLLEVRMSNNDLKEYYVGSIKTCIESILICFANKALLSIDALFTYMHEQVIEMTGYRGIFGNMNIMYQISK